MKSKTLLIAAAALAAGIISSQAQSVYSQNVVGYVNLTITNNALYTVTALQLQCGVSNGLNEVFSSFGPAQSGDTVFLWDSTGQQFAGGGYNFYWDPSLNGGAGGPSWYDQAGNGSLLTSYPKIKVGSSAFIQGSGIVNPSDTLTLVGQVSIASGTTNSLPFLGGGFYSLVGSQLPQAGGLVGLGLVPPDGTLAFIWNPVTQAFKGGGYAYYEQFGWYDQAGNGALVTGTGVTFTNSYGVWSDIPVKVGDGVFVQGGVGGSGTTNWVQSFNNN
ncbi:MAG: hypothetical protein WCS42_12265 [Verrucomicrobiota bacterium]